MEKAGELIDWRAVFFVLLFIIVLIAVVSAVKVVKNDDAELTPIVQSDSVTRKVVIPESLLTNKKDINNLFLSNGIIENSESEKDYYGTEEDQIIEKNGKKYVIRDDKEYLLSSIDYYIKFDPALPSKVCDSSKIDIRVKGVGKYSPDAGESIDCGIKGYVSVCGCINLMEADGFVNPDDPVTDVCDCWRAYQNMNTNPFCTKFNFDATLKDVDLSPFIKEDAGSEGEFYVKIYDPTDHKITEMSSLKSDVGIGETSHHYPKCYSDDVYWYSSCNKREDKIEECGSDSCSSWTNFCQSNDVYRKRTCYDKGCDINIYGDPACFSEPSTEEELKQDCGEDSQRDYCEGNSVWRESIDKGCSSGSCTQSTTNNKIKDCTSNEKCENGACVPVTCSSDSQCPSDGYTGTPFCQTSDVYQNWRDNYCDKPGTPQSQCLYSESSKKKVDCGEDSYSANYCYNSDVYRDFIDRGCSNNDCFSTTTEQLVQDCPNGCEVVGGNARCKGQIPCNKDADCGINSPNGDRYCGTDGAVHQKWLVYKCNNPGTPQSSCSNNPNQDVIVEQCTSGKICQNGQCVDGGNNFRGEYYNNKYLNGQPVLIRSDSSINFDWGFGSPDSSVQSNGFSVRWTKTQFFSSGRYKFNALVDDGVRVYIDNQIVIDAWRGGGATLFSGEKDLSGGNHEIKVEYFEDSGPALIQFSWENIVVGSCKPGEYKSNPGTGNSCCFNGQEIKPNALVSNDNRFLCADGQLYVHDGETYGLPIQRVQTSCTIKGNYYAYPNYPNAEWQGGWKQGNGEGVQCGSDKFCNNGICQTKSSENLITNGDFSSGSNSWNRAAVFPGYAVVDSINKYLVIGDFGYAYQKVASLKNSQGKTFTLTFRATKSSGAAGEVDIQELPSWQTKSNIKLDSNDWKDYSLTFTVPTNNEHIITLTSTLGSRGNVFFDDVRLVENQNVIDSAFCQKNQFYSSSISVANQGCCFSGQLVDSNSLASDYRFLCIDGKIFSHTHGIATDTWTTNVPSCTIKGNYYAYPNWPYAEWLGGWSYDPINKGNNIVCGVGKSCQNGDCR